jgi:cephalosporin hydroxylase
MSIDVSNNFTPLCRLAFHYSTDKSVYNLMNHRHPYTPIYHMFFNSYRKKALKIGEVGILNGASMFMWNDYFTHPGKVIHGYDIDPTSLEKIKDIPNSQGFLVDAGSSSGLKASLTKACSEDKELYDILIEDASHRLEHQLIFLRDAIHFVKPGGLLVIEDIFREISPARFEEVLDLISDEITNAILIKPEHFFRHSPGWDNDQILIVFKA